MFKRRTTVEMQVMAWSSDWASVGKPKPSQGSSDACNTPNWPEGWSQDPAFCRPHLSVGSEGKGILLEIPVYLMLFEGEQSLSFFSVFTVAVLEHLFTCSSLWLCYHANFYAFCHATVLQSILLLVLISVTIPMHWSKWVSFPKVVKIY